jgi:AraC family transcriptional regulator of arabinose operon
MDHRVQFVLALLSTSRHRHLTDLAADVGLSVSRLSHLVKAETGRAIGEHIRVTRLRQAAELLLLSPAGKKEIAFAVGFRRTSHFVQAFRRAFGRTPGQYRKDALTS